MIITCTKCNTDFRVDETILKTSANKFRCSACKSVFSFSVQMEDDDSSKVADRENNLIPENKELNLASDELFDPDDIGFDAETEVKDFDLELDSEDEKPPDGGNIDASDIGLKIDSNLKGSDGLNNTDTELDGIKEEFSTSDLIEETDMEDLEDLLEFDSEDLISGDKSNLEDMDLTLDEESFNDEPDSLENKNGKKADEELDLADLEGMLEMEDNLQPFQEQDVENTDLELDLELGDADEEPEVSVTIKKTEEVNLEDLEDFLELDSVELVSDDKLNLEDTDLTLDEESFDDEQDMLESKHKEEATEEINLSDLESMLEIEDDFQPSQGQPTDDDLELELEINDTDEDSDAAIPIETAEETKKKGTGFELEFDLNDEEIEEQPVPDTPQEEEIPALEKNEEVFPEAVAPIQHENIVRPVIPARSDMQAAPQPVMRKHSPKKGKVKKALIFIFVLIILAGGFCAGVIFLDTKGIRFVPVTDYVKSVSRELVVKGTDTIDVIKRVAGNFIDDKRQQDISGSKGITPLDSTINGRYVENIKSGQLFVITGQVRNDYDHPRSFIKISANLIAKNETRSRKVFCGNLLSMLDIENLDLDTIISRLKNEHGDNNSNVDLSAGNMLQFMVVFNNLSDDIESFNVQVESSVP